MKEGLTDKASVEKDINPTETTVPTKYIYYDIVKFTVGRSVEVQSEIIGILNDIILKSVKKHKKEDDECIYLPTGDGICVVLLNVGVPFDIHINIALSSLESLVEYNTKTEDPTAQFEVRIGVNENVDNIVTDINGRRNIAGEGINVAHRIMSLSDGGQILVGDSVYQVLKRRHRYMKAFKTFQKRIKHGELINVHQLILEECTFLSKNTPVGFRKKEKIEPKLPKTVAYYFAHAIKNQSFAIQLDFNRRHMPVLLWMLAGDSYEASKATDIDPFKAQVYKAGEVDISEQFKFYASSDFWLLVEFKDMMDELYFPGLDGYFSDFPDFCFVNEEGKAKLKEEWPDIWTEFDLDNVV